MSVKGEIVQIHIGQAGVQIANACWELYCLEHGINSSGIMVHKPMDTSFLTFFTCSTIPFKVIPRQVMIDSEPTVIDEIRTGSYRQLFHPDTLISGNEDSGSNFARGYNLVVTELLDRAMNAIRFVVGNCKNLRGFVLFHSIGGGTGSGFYVRLLEELTACFGSKVTIIDFVVFPSPTLSSVIVEPYNVALACHMSADHSSVTCIVDNEALYDICSNRLGVLAPSYTHLNRLIAQVVSAFTAPQRFTGPLLVGFEELKTNLVPFPRCKYPLLSYSPIFACNRSQYNSPTVEQLTFDCFSPYNQMARCDITCGQTMGAILLYRGAVFSSEINSALYSLKNSKFLRFVDWCPTGFKTGICSVPPCFVPCTDMTPTTRAVVSLSNNTGIVMTWNRVVQKFNDLYKRKAFLYHYVGEGLEESCFDECSEFFMQLIADYEELASNPSENC